MARTSRGGSHRSKGKRFTLVLAPIAALGIIVPLMNNANAATPKEVIADCASNSDKLANCEFIDVQFRVNNFGPNERVTSITDNCGHSTDSRKSFTGTATVGRFVAVESGANVEGGLMLNTGLFEIGGKFVHNDWDIKRDDTASSFSFSRSDVAKADHISFFMWSHKRTDVSGYLKATYKDGTVSFAPREGGTTQHVFFPQILKNGTPDGRLWLRNIKCGTPQANAILRSGNSVRVEPGFGQAGAGSEDIEVPVSDAGFTPS